MKVSKLDDGFIIEHGDTRLKIFSSGDSIYLQDLIKDRMFGAITGSEGTIVNYG